MGKNSIFNDDQYDDNLCDAPYLEPEDVSDIKKPIIEKQRDN